MSWALAIKFNGRKSLATIASYDSLVEGVYKDLYAGGDPWDVPHSVVGLTFLVDGREVPPPREELFLAWCPRHRQVSRVPHHGGQLCQQDGTREQTRWRDFGTACRAALLPWPELEAALLLVGTSKDVRDRVAREMVHARQFEEWFAAERRVTPTVDDLKAKFNRGRR